MKIIKSFKQWLSDALNPILVKELRQSVQSNMVSVIMALFLSVCIAWIMITVLSRTSTNNTLSYNRSVGMARETFFGLFVILTITVNVIVSLYTSARMSMERQQSNMDLLYITTLSPWKIIRGKLVSAIVLVTLFYFMAMPFISFTYLLRGLDLPSLFFILGMCFIATIVALQFSIFVACLPASTVFRFVLGICLITALIAYSITIMGFSNEAVRNGIWSKIMNNDESLWLAIFILLGLVISLGLLYILTVMMVSPPTSNRVFPLRVYLSTSWLFGLALCYYMVDHNPFGLTPAHAHEFLKGWFVISTLVFSISMFFSTSEREEPSPRILHKIPNSMIKRVLIWPFYSGGANSFTWCFIVLTLTNLIYYSYSYAIHGSMKHYSYDFAQKWTAFAFYTAAYVMTGLYIRRLAGAKSHWSWVYNLVFVAIMFVLPILLIYIFGSLRYDFYSSWPYGSVIDLFESRSRTQLHYFTSLIWAIIAFAINTKWMSTQMFAFIPIHKK